MWATPIAVMPFVEQGKVKVLGIATRQRIATFPQVATVDRGSGICCRHLAGDRWSGERATGHRHASGASHSRGPSSFVNLL
jgi:hypothetical protein